MIKAIFIISLKSPENPAFSCQYSCAQLEIKAVVSLSEDTMLGDFGVHRINRHWKARVEAGPEPRRPKSLGSRYPIKEKLRNCPISYSSVM